MNLWIVTLPLVQTEGVQTDLLEGVSLVRLVDHKAHLLKFFFIRRIGLDIHDQTARGLAKLLPVVHIIRESPHPSLLHYFKAYPHRDLVSRTDVQPTDQRVHPRVICLPIHGVALRQFPLLESQRYHFDPSGRNQSEGNGHRVLRVLT